MDSAIPGAGTSPGFEASLGERNGSLYPAWIVLSQAQFRFHFLGISAKNLKGLRGKEILGHSVMLSNICKVIPFKNILEEHEELQQCLGTSGLKNWEVDQDYLAACLSWLGLDFDIQGVLFLSGLFLMVG